MQKAINFLAVICFILWIASKTFLHSTYLILLLIICGGVAAILKIISINFIETSKNKLNNKTHQKTTKIFQSAKLLVILLLIILLLIDEFIVSDSRISKLYFVIFSALLILQVLELISNKQSN